MTRKRNISKKNLGLREKWRVTQKKMKNEGNAFINEKGQQIKEKVLGPPCVCTCRYKCTENFSEKQRESIFNMFWSLGDRRKQWEFVVNNTKKIPTIRPTTKHPIPYRQNTIVYYLSSEGKNKKRVCKTMFLSTIASGIRIVSTAWRKYDGRTVVEDKRGKHPKHKRKQE